MKSAKEYKNIVFDMGEVLALKPQPIIYQMFFDRFSLDPADCLFIDDLKDNVDASIACGMDAWCFSSGDNEDMKRFLEIEA